MTFTFEDDFTHCIQDENHDSRRAGLSVGAIGKPYRGRRRRITPYNKDSLSTNFKSMSIETQFNDLSNEANIYAPYAVSYGQPPPNLSSSIDGEYERYNLSFFYTNVVLPSISNATTRISNEHIGKPWISHPWTGCG